ncbi:MAG TPA: YkgJ family cysteine cluster protein [Acidobacteriota bacterium]|nr:YkgJ family cysteine cluster protein [Acidobacteriota bacterium]HNG93729.1 YkgJ family cysteine cluster protein [Acidobacteriota bacterium]HNH82194.1 YkgJ family cysteine cluster protein [Acidobacteriota bacterium]HNJ43572.1 YkgJ family cysteine cluster protein [Acidobacteriota bacterium]
MSRLPIVTTQPDLTRRRTRQLPVIVKRTLTHFDRQSKIWLESVLESGDLPTNYCGQGCFHCCEFPVQATLLEAQHLAAGLPESIWPVIARRVEHLQRLAGEARDLSDFDEQVRHRLGTCALLDEARKCLAYSRRPLGCRKTYSTLPGDYCARTAQEQMTPQEWHQYQHWISVNPLTGQLDHYIEPLNDFGSELSEKILEAMERELGFSVEGELTVLLWLTRSAEVMEGFWNGDRSRLQSVLDQLGLAHPFLTLIDAQPSPCSGRGE